MTKRRLDVLLVDRGLAESREKAQALVMAGQVRVDERPAMKAGVLVREDVALDVEQPARYVSRGGEKLEHALDAFGLDVSGLVAADIGSSTGGFADCLLQHGAARVYAVDVGRGQLDYRLRQDSRVVVMEETNVRELGGLPEAVEFVVVDVSFISLKLVLPVVAGLLAPHPDPVRLKPDPREQRGARGSIVLLFKPQFEAGRDEVPRGGVIRDPQLHATLIGRFVDWCTGKGFRVLDMVASPILGAEGNREFLFWLRPQAPHPISPDGRLKPSATGEAMS
jgi:23S rRNA (cytidine1920-2'-O)/16S rRNA (cytidine1409-2'-O)-methyltransferase